MAGEVGSGIAGGALTGASYGTSILPGWGTAIGAVVGGVAGGFQGANAKKKREAAEKANAAVNADDPQQVAYLERLRRQERYFRNGNDTQTAFAIRNAKQVLGNTQNNLLRAGGPGVVGNLMRANVATGNTIAGISAQAQDNADRAMYAQGGLIGEIANRKYERQREVANQAMARSVAARNDLNNQLAGGLSSMGSLGMSAGFKGMGGAKSRGGSFGGGELANGSMMNGIYRRGVYNNQPGYDGLGGGSTNNFGLDRSNYGVLPAWNSAQYAAPKVKY